MFYFTGDLVVCDELGYLYFKDRTGDTFRYVFVRNFFKKLIKTFFLGGGFSSNIAFFKKKK